MYAKYGDHMKIQVGPNRKVILVQGSLQVCQV